MVPRLQRFMHSHGVPSTLQLAALCLLPCLVLFGGMWGCTYIGIPTLAKTFNVLLLLAVFVNMIFLIVTLIVILIELIRKLLNLHASR